MTLDRSLKGKNVAVTGSTGGLGRELCRKIAALGGNLILVDRNMQKSKEHREELLSKYPDITINCIHLDLEDLSMAEDAVNKLIELNVDIMFHNAGAYSIPRHKCKSGYDNVFQINFATPYYMVRRLLPYLKMKKGKVIVVGSIAHNYSRIDNSDIDFSRRNASSKVYGNSKRYLMFSLYELFKDETEVTLSVVHPGITFTNITAHYPKLIFAIIKYPMKIIFMKPKHAVMPLVEGIFKSTPYLHWIGPRYFDVWGSPEMKKVKTCTAEESANIAHNAEKVFEICQKTINND